MLSGCAVQFRDGSGTTHIIGLAHVEVRGTTSGRSEVIAQQVSTIGAALLFLPEHSGIALGYSRNFTLEINSTDGAGELSKLLMGAHPAKALRLARDAGVLLHFLPEFEPAIAAR